MGGEGKSVEREWVDTETHEERSEREGYCAETYGHLRCSRKPRHTNPKHLHITLTGAIEWQFKPAKRAER